MTNEQINMAIAKAVGWKDNDHPDCIAKKRTKGLMAEIWILRPDGELVFGNDIPNYCNDLNAMHEAESVLTDDQYVFFSGLLYDLECNRQEQSKKWKWLSATARQRAEAFLRTIGRWEE